jgi:hypothetical protein
MTTSSIGRETCAPKPGKFRRRRPAKSLNQNANKPDEEYRVGPGRPPREFQFKPGQSGNPKGAKRKHPIVPDLKATLERALNGTVALKQGEKERTVSKVEAGIVQLVNAFAAGDRHARRDLIDLAQRLDVDLVGRQRRAIETALQTPISAEDQAVLADFLKRHSKVRDNATEPQPAQFINSKDDGGQYESQN